MVSIINQTEVATFFMTLTGKILSEKQGKEIVKGMREIDNKSLFYSNMYKYFFKKDITHITDKKNTNHMKLLHEIAKYHFTKEE